MSTLLRRMPKLRPSDGMKLNQVDSSRIEVVFFDLDDTLYQNGYTTEGKVQVALERYAADKFGLSGKELFDMYLEYGTTLKGLLSKGMIHERDIPAYLEAIYDFDKDDVRPIDGLRDLVLRVSKRRFIFTASTFAHAKKCLDALGIADLFEGIIDTAAVGYNTKYTAEAYVEAMKIAQVLQPEQCMLVDDSVKNITAARRFGWNTVLCGEFDSRQRAKPLAGEFFVEHIGQLSEKCPFLFRAFSLNDSAHGTEDGTGVAPEHIAICGGVALNQENPTKRRVIFVVGAEGAGKGEVANELGKTLDVAVLSVSGLLQKTSKDRKSVHRKTVVEHQKSERSIPPALAIELLLAELASLEHSACVVHGFPRDVESLQGWLLHPKLKAQAYVAGAVNVECGEETSVKRLLQRRAGAANVKALKKRVVLSKQATALVVEELRNIPNVDIWTVNSKDENFITASAKAVDLLVEKLPELAL